LIFLNFTHRLTPAQLRQIEAIAGGPIERTIEVSAHFDVARPFAEQAVGLVDSAGLTPEDWETLPLVVNLPALSVIAGLVVAEIHGRSGHFPAILRLRPLVGSPVQAYEAAEILNLQQVRDLARAVRRSLDTR